MAGQHVVVTERANTPIALIAAKLKGLQRKLAKTRHVVPLLRRRDDVGHIVKTRGQLSEQIAYCEINPAGRLFAWNTAHPSIRLPIRLPAALQPS